jgi:hypothetical protein
LSVSLNLLQCQLVVPQLTIPILKDCASLRVSWAHIIDLHSARVRAGATGREEAFAGLQRHADTDDFQLARTRVAQLSVQ